jgi:hypothetical protein
MMLYTKPLGNMANGGIFALTLKLSLKQLLLQEGSFHGLTLSRCLSSVALL